MSGKDMIYGAIGGFVATETDKALIEIGISTPLGSMLFVLIIGIILFREYKEQQLKKLGEKQ